MSETNRNLGRRDVLRLMVVGGAGLAVAACGGSSGPTCTDTTGLAEADVTMRTSQGYVEASTHGADNCAACTFYTAGAAGACGTCTVIRGPINPAGYCNLFSRRPA